MKIGGNRKAREFLDAQPDWNNDLPIIQKYKSQAAAKLKKKIQIESEEGTWDPVADSLKEQIPSQIEPSNLGYSIPALSDPETPEHVGCFKLSFST